MGILQERGGVKLSVGHVMVHVMFHSMHKRTLIIKDGRPLMVGYSVGHKLRPLSDIR